MGGATCLKEADLISEFRGIPIEGQQSLQQTSLQSAIITAMGFLLRSFFFCRTDTTTTHRVCRHPCKASQAAMLL